MKPGALAHGRVGLGERERVLARQEAVADRLAEAVEPRRIDDLPPAGRGRVDAAPGLDLAREAPPARAEGVAVRIAGTGRERLRPDLVDAVLAAVDVEVEAHVEEVLVHHRVEARRDERAVRGALARRDRAGREHARELDLERDRAVLVEVPEEAVVVVPDRRERGDHEPARAAHLAGSVAPLDVAPEHADVLLVDADRVRDRQRLARGVRDDRVQVDDLAEAVAAARERGGGDADAVLAAVEGVLPVVARARIAVRHDHLRERRAVQDRAQPAAVVVGDLVEHEAFARREADVHPPALPRQHAAVEREARAFGLRDLERRDVVAQRGGRRRRRSCRSRAGSARPRDRRCAAPRAC